MPARADTPIVLSLSMCRLLAHSGSFRPLSTHNASHAPKSSAGDCKASALWSVLSNDPDLVSHPGPDPNPDPDPDPDAPLALNCWPSTQSATLTAHGSMPSGRSLGCSIRAYVRIGCRVRLIPEPEP